MTKNLNNPSTRIKELTDILNRMQYEYYVLSVPSMSDREYDRLYDELLRLEGEHPGLVLPDSPTQRVGSDLSQDLPEAEHSIPVLSLDKSYTIEDIYSWINKTNIAAGRELTYVLEEKIDGASVVLYYEEGLLKRAVTRGNGYTGNDITGNIKTIKSVPIKLPDPVTVAVRSEVFLPVSIFQDINSRMETPYANPRNLASGTLRRVKSSKVAEIPLDIFVYEGFFQEEQGSHLEIMHRLKELNFKLNPHIYYFSNDKSLHREILNKHEEWYMGGTDNIEKIIKREGAERKNLDYDIDGLVLKVNEIEAREKLGYTGHHPRWAMAFKFDSPEGITVINQIDLQIGRTGRVTPVARVEPVEISGSTVSNVTLHNQEYIEMLEVAVGDTVAVSKRGEIIPAVERVIEPNDQGNKTFTYPETCPTCGSAMEKEGAHHFCRNSNCPDQVKGRIHFFASRNNMDIENLGPETLNTLIEKKLVLDIQDIYTFDPGMLEGAPGFAEKKIKLIREGIEKSKNRPFETVLQSIGIPEIGQKVIELLVNAGYKDIDSLLSLAEKGDPAPLISIHGIGEKTAETIINELTDPDVLKRICALRELGLNFVSEPPGTETDEKDTGIFSGQTWCITGSFKNFRPREKAAEEIKRKGGKITSSVTSGTTRLLTGESPGSKFEKAKNLGVEIISEDLFLEMIKTN